MQTASMDRKLNLLFRQEKWASARKLMEGERKRKPKSHWIITQIGVTYYEERKYGKALEMFLRSQRLVPDCPLTLWNLAGALDALGRSSEAIEVYNVLLSSNASADEDPCWESAEWAAALKADCIFRLGACFKNLGICDKAERCFQEYFELLLAGVQGIYTFDDVARELRELPSPKGESAAERLRKAIASTLRLSSGSQSQIGRTKMAKAAAK